MINTEIQKAMEGHLLAGETILWAEKTNHSAQNEHKEKFHLSPQKSLVLKCVCALGLVGLIVSFNIPKGIDVWGTSTQKFLYMALSSVSLYSFVIAAVRLFQNMVVGGRIYNIGAHGLTNKRLFEFDHEMVLIRHLDASRLRYVSGFEGVKIKPIGGRGNRSYQLGLMANNVLTINFLQPKITEARQQDSSTLAAKPLAHSSPKL